MALSFEAMHILQEQLVAREGYRQFPYRDTKGILTIGIGRNLEQVGIDLDEAQMLLSNDINDAVKLLERLDWYNNLEEMRKIVIINMCFNIGYSKLLQFKKMIAALQIHNYAEAAKEMLSSLWAIQVPNRAKILADALINNGIKVPV